MGIGQLLGDNNGTGRQDSALYGLAANPQEVLIRHRVGLVNLALVASFRQSRLGQYSHPYVDIGLRGA